MVESLEFLYSAYSKWCDY